MQRQSITIYPCAKINLGLNITERRSDGYHNLETVFYPVPIFDTLTITECQGNSGCKLATSGIAIEGNTEDNIVVKAYNAISKLYKLPGIEVSLEKAIPTQAGMGGGSADCAFAITGINRLFGLNLSNDEMRKIAAGLGADCAFFVSPTPSYASGIGEVLSPIQLDLSRYWIVVVKNDTAVSTKEAFSGIIPKAQKNNCRDIVLSKPIEEWKDLLTNDFETTIFKIHPILGEIKNWFYNIGAVYSAMSGSGSSIFGIFKEPPSDEEIKNMECRFKANVFTKKLQGFCDKENEMLPVVDEGGNTVGMTTRAMAHNGSKILHPVVHLHVFNESGDIFLQKRPAWKDIQPNKWDTAVGGHMDCNETVAAALKREAKEELGITVADGKMIGSYIFESSVEKEFVNVFSIVYNNEIHPSEKELDGGRFWTREEIISAFGKGILTPNFESEYQKFFM